MDNLNNKENSNTHSSTNNDKKIEFDNRTMCMRYKKMSDDKKQLLALDDSDFENNDRNEDAKGNERGKPKRTVICKKYICWQSNHKPVNSNNSSEETYKHIAESAKKLDSGILGVSTKVVRTFDELPDEVKKKFSDSRDDIKGINYDGTVYIVADKVTSENDLCKTWMHENVGHKALDALMDAKTSSEYLNNLFNLIKQDKEGKSYKSIKAIAKKYNLNLSDSIDRVDAMREYIALLAEQETLPQKRVGFFKKACKITSLSLTKSWHKLTGNNAELVEDEIKELLQQMKDVTLSGGLQKRRDFTSRILARIGWHVSKSHDIRHCSIAKVNEIEHGPGFYVWVNDKDDESDPNKRNTSVMTNMLNYGGWNPKHADVTAISSDERKKFLTLDKIDDREAIDKWYEEIKDGDNEKLKKFLKDYIENDYKIIDFSHACDGRKEFYELKVPEKNECIIENVPFNDQPKEVQEKFLKLVKGCGFDPQEFLELTKKYNYLSPIQILYDKFLIPLYNKDNDEFDKFIKKMFGENLENLPEGYYRWFKKWGPMHAPGSSQSDSCVLISALLPLFGIKGKIFSGYGYKPWSVGNRYGDKFDHDKSCIVIFDETAIEIVDKYNTEEEKIKNQYVKTFVKLSRTKCKSVEEFQETFNKVKTLLNSDITGLDDKDIIEYSIDGVVKSLLSTNIDLLKSSMDNESIKKMIDSLKRIDKTKPKTLQFLWLGDAINKALNGIERNTPEYKKKEEERKEKERLENKKIHDMISNIDNMEDSEENFKKLAKKLDEIMRISSMVEDEKPEFSNEEVLKVLHFFHNSKYDLNKLKDKEYNSGYGFGNYGGVKELLRYYDKRFGTALYDNDKNYYSSSDLIRALLDNSDRIYKNIQDKIQKSTQEEPKQEPKEEPKEEPKQEPKEEPKQEPKEEPKEIKSLDSNIDNIKDSEENVKKIVKNLKNIIYNASDDEVLKILDYLYNSKYEADKVENIDDLLEHFKKRFNFIFPVSNVPNDTYKNNRQMRILLSSGNSLLRIKKKEAEEKEKDEKFQKNFKKIKDIINTQEDTKENFKIICEHLDDICNGNKFYKFSDNEKIKALYYLTHSKQDLFSELSKVNDKFENVYSMLSFYLLMNHIFIPKKDITNFDLVKKKIEDKYKEISSSQIKESYHKFFKTFLEFIN